VRDQPVEILGRRVRLVDLSHPLGPSGGEPVAPRVERLGHDDGAGLWEALYGIPRDALPGGHGFAGETFHGLSTHAGTHVDAPWHYAPVAGGGPAPAIDEVPLSWCVGPLVVLDVSDRATGDLLGPADVDERLERLGHAPSPGDVVALFTGAERAWGNDEFWRVGCGLGREAVLGLLERGVRAIGTDAWSLDRPYPLIGEEWRERRDPAALWPAHFAGIERPYLQLEKLANLATVPPTGATIVAFPVKVEGGSGAWTRAVALVPA
jgi:kynurenine formamidase